MLKDNNNNHSSLSKEKYNSTLDVFFSQNQDNTILENEIKSWENFSLGLRRNNRILFKQMLQSCYKYSPPIKVMGNQRSADSLFMTILVVQYKQLFKK